MSYDGTETKRLCCQLFNLTSREDCIQSGQFHVRNMSSVFGFKDARGDKNREALISIVIDLVMTTLGQC